MKYFLHFLVSMPTELDWKGKEDYSCLFQHCGGKSDDASGPAPTLDACIYHGGNCISGIKNIPNAIA
jgi:hypothetical protein